MSALLLAACGAKSGEKITPLYQSEKIELRDADVDFWTDINPTTIEPSAIRKFARTLFGWIPLIGDIVELPLDLTAVVLPPLKATSRPELPPDGEWNDPRLLNIVKNLKLGEGYIRITPVEQRKDYEPEKCWIFWDCDDVEFPDFLKEVRIYLLFKDMKPEFRARNKMKSLKEQPEVLLASADVEKNYDGEKKMLHFNVSEENIRPYLEQYGKFEIKIVARGGFPRRRVYLDGKLRIDMRLKLAKEASGEGVEETEIAPADAIVTPVDAPVPAPETVWPEESN